MRKTTSIILGILLGCGVLLSCIWVYFQKSMEQIDLEEMKKSKTYANHYVLIGDDRDSMLWEAVYESACGHAADADAYLELLYPENDPDNTLEDCLQISIASQVDGIILRPDGSSRIRELIGAAAEAGIPVVAVLEDDSESDRISFVGLNSYQMGDAYTEQVVHYLNEDVTDVMILIDENSQGTEMSLIYSQMVNAVEKGKKEGQTVNIIANYVENSTDFESEESIRDIFVNEDPLPDIIVCLDEVLTECAYQALVDYNEVGNVDIIGFYYSDLILEAVKRGTMPATIALDTEEIGKYCVEALEEYRFQGHTSNYYSVGLKVITAENVDLFQEETADAGE